MGSDFNSVSSGQKLRIKAATWNRVLQMARDDNTKSGGTSAAADLETLGLDPICMENTTEEALTVGSIVGLGDLIATPVEDSLAWQQAFAIKAVEPTWPGSRNIAVIIETIAPGACGRAVICGYQWVQVEITNGGLPKYARPIAGETEKLQLYWWGPCRIVAREEGTSGTKWALVEIGSFYHHNYIGKSVAAIAKGSAGDVKVHDGIAGETEETDGIIENSFAHWGAVSPTKEVRVCWDNDGPEIDQQEC